MKSRPILMSGPLVRAILAGKKTQTRRPITQRSSGACHTHHKSWLNWDVIYPNNPYGIKVPSKIDDTVHRVDPPYDPGDQLWVRETWQHTKCLNINPEDENYGYVYRADQQPWDDYEGWRWKPSIFMPREACRVTLEVEEIKVERLHDISEEDAKAEGVEPVYGSYRTAFAFKWEEIYGEKAWDDQNPWVWAIKFRRITP